ncbi:ABC transporter ATP-binding protein [Aeromonas hydrophila]|uniref:ABC transporter ATP-binding protein n=1 Tax=Aeromonas hydrophila TaxID=644 RepID=UPI002361073C|nr:ABC transporter ATP-binding protein [Aeromonas hydrophila]WDA23102.1 ABC transporter ATP-binding protein [Aeromonas hydrophila]WES93165.1 ABC transporter ATP-binding protein [Aeromonas hydrophila]
MSNLEDDTGWLTLWRMVKVQQGCLSASMIFTCFAALLELLPFWLLFQAMEAVLGYYQHDLSSPELITALYHSALGMMVALAAKTMVYALAYGLSHKAAFGILTHIRRLLVTRLAWAPVHWLQKYHSGQLKLAVLQDVERVENFVAHHTVEVLVSAIGPVVVTGYLLWVDWRLALASLLVAPLAVLSSMLVMRGMNHLYAEYHQASVSLNSITVEYLRNMPVMKIFQQDSRRFKAMVDSLDQYYSMVAKITKVTVPRWALFTCLLGANLLVILPVAMVLYQAGEVRLLDVLMAVMLGAGMLRPLLKISYFFTEIKEVLAGVKRLAPIMAAPTTANTSLPTALETPLQVTFKDVSFGYDCLPVLNGINLVLAPGATTVLMGRSGGGKSTLAQLLAGLLVPDSGEVLVNGVPISSLDNQQRASLIAVASQDVFLFKGTIRDNLQLARDGISEQDMYQAVAVAQAQELIQRLPEGYDTQLQEQGVRLSGGEKQRIALARALLADTPILVLDEATAFADSLTQKAFYHALKLHYPEKTVLVIAHRTYGLESADLISIIEDGLIQSQGSHAHLLITSDYYRQIWQLQKDSDNWSIGVVKNQSVTKEVVHEG